MLIDSHCHINDKRFEGQKDFILKKLAENKIEKIINVGCDEIGNEQSVQLAKENDEIFAAVGFHPEAAERFTSESLYRMEELCREKKVVAIGEIGLDYHYEKPPRDIQKIVFAEQLRFAHDIGKPIIIHLRDAYSDMEQILAENSGYLTNGILFHCYSGSAEMVKVFGKYDSYFALGGAATYSKKSKEVAEAIPTDRLLLETDSPYLTPVPYRGQLNYPHNVRVVAEHLAALIGTDIQTFEQATYENTKRFFKF